MKSIHTIFYSWQSDLSKDTNQNAIRQALRDASSLIEDELEDIRIDTDEATRDATGSPNIPKMIFEKIDVCDVFLCDLTTINSRAETQRPVPNPNVLIELGYAIAKIGWERIILVFNKYFGTFPDDLPFDIDRHRTTPFIIKDKNDNSGKKNLAAVLKVAIKSIIEKSPLKPEEKRKMKPEEQKRFIDIKNAKLALNAIHIPTFDKFLDSAPQNLPKEIFYFKDKFISILDSSDFFLYDNELLEKLNKLKMDWATTLSFGQYYSPDGSGLYYTYYIPMDVFPTDESEKDFYKLVAIINDLRETFTGIIKYIRHYYLEIDIDKISEQALEEYKNDLKIYQQ